MNNYSSTTGTPNLYVVKNHIHETTHLPKVNKTIIRHIHESLRPGGYVARDFI